MYREQIGSVRERFFSPRKRYRVPVKKNDLIYLSPPMQSTWRAAKRVPHNLPNVQTSFIGCESARIVLSQLLRTKRLVTITGSGGSGKTRLALVVAEDVLASFPDGVFWVDLARLSDGSLVAQTVAGVLGIREQMERSFIETILDSVRERSMLLILDNCEHLLSACRDLIQPLLQACAGVRVLATSREAIGLPDELVWPAPMLALPEGDKTRSLGQLMQVESVRLFVERARAVAPTFVLNESNAEAVAQICRRLDGMPLAIELAAARVNVLSPHQILARLDDSMRLLTRARASSDARHQTLRAALDWSYALLTSAEQQLFARLAVFAGCFGLDAVEGICADAVLERGALLDLLTNLVEKSLVMVSEQEQEMRYRLLIPIQHYAAERLRLQGEDEIWRSRHAAWYRDLAQEAARELLGADQVQWLNRLEMEYDNLRAALGWYSAVPGDTASGLQLGSALARFWCMRGYTGEGQQWMQGLHARMDESVAPRVQVDVLNALGRLCFQRCNYEAARGYWERAVTLARQLEYEEGIEAGLTGLGAALWDLGELQEARRQLETAAQYMRHAQHWQPLAQALNLLGLICIHQGEGEIASAYLDESLAINRREGNKVGIATVLLNMAILTGQRGDYGRARLLYQEALLIDRELGNRSTVADVLSSLGLNAVTVGDFSAAAAYFEEAGALYQELGDLGDMGYVYAGLADIAFYQREYERARSLYQEALACFREAGNQRLMGRVLGRLGRIACREGDLATAAALCAEALAVRRAIGHKAGMIFSLDEGYAELALAAGQPALAARLLGAADAARQAIAYPREPVETEQIEILMERLHEHLGPGALTAAWVEGQAMQLERAAAYALDSLSPAIVVQSRPEIRIYGLGQARIYRGDKLLSSSDWTYAKARELVFYLLCRPSATREQIGLDFWPDASAEQVRKRFSAALAHARNALGRASEWITLADGRYRIAPGQSYWFDVEVFESRLHNAKSLLESGAPQEQAVPLLEEAILLYGGDFVEDFVEGEWFLALRSALQADYLEALMLLGAIHTQAGRFLEAIEVYKRAVAKDPYMEEAHHALILCYARLHRRSQALRQYEQLCDAMAELNATPSQETEALVARLRQGEHLS